MSDGLVQVVDLNAVGAPGANTNIPGGTVTPLFPGWIDVEVQLATGSVFNVIETPASGSNITHPAQLGVALVAAKTYTFSMPVSPRSTYNFQVETNGIITRLLVNHYKNA